jgi:hypothetical protein
MAEIDHGQIMLGNGAVERPAEGEKLVDLQIRRGILEGLFRIADGLKIGHEIALFSCRQAELVVAIEVIDDLGEGGEAAVVKIGRREIGIEQSLGLIGAAGADVVLQMIDEEGRRPMAAGAGLIAHLGEAAVEQQLAAMGGRIGGIRQLPIRLQFRIWQIVDLFHKGDDGVHQLRRGLRSVELVDDHIAGKIAERGDAAVAPIRGEVADAAQARDVDVAVQIVGGLGLNRELTTANPPGRSESPGMNMS